MKKGVLVLAVLVCMAFQANAQRKGQFWIGGSVGYTVNDPDEGGKEQSLGVGPELGYAFSNHWSVGLSFGYWWEKSEINSEGDYYSKSNTYSVTPFVRYSFCQGKIGGFFIDGRIGYNHSVNEIVSSFTEKIQSDIYLVGFRPGVSLNLGKRVAATASINLLSFEYLDTDSAHSIRVNANNSFLLSNLSFGLNYRF